MNAIKNCIITNHKDDKGNPTGGGVQGDGLSINWQNGPLGRGTERKVPNGAFVETVINAALIRIQFYQDSPYACEENARAATHLQEALFWLDHRTRDREARQVEGTHTV